MKKMLYVILILLGIVQIIMAITDFRMLTIVGAIQGILVIVFCIKTLLDTREKK